MREIVLIKNGELALKGLNRSSFEDVLIKNMRRHLAPLGTFQFTKSQSTIMVEPEDPDTDLDDTVDALTRVFGIAALSRAAVCEKDKEDIAATALEYLKEPLEDAKTFKVEAKRSDKKFPMKSPEICREMGGRILRRFHHLKVDVHNPDIRLNVEIREEVYIYSRIIPGPGGMPIGTNGSAMLLLSGGIDSPVAGYMIAKRGVTIDATYFHAPPYTSERAKQKVVDLAKIISKYTGPINLHVVNFTDIQLYIYEQCPHEELTIIMRRYMMKLAEHFAKENKCLGLITGESIGQVASQTMQSLAATNEVCTMPVYRPLIGFDKQEIVEISEKIDAYETSILPYEDCCTTFVAKHPVTHPVLSAIEKSEAKLEGIIEPLYRKAVDTEEIVMCRAKQ